MQTGTHFFCPRRVTCLLCEGCASDQTGREGTHAPEAVNYGSGILATSSARARVVASRRKGLESIGDRAE